MFTPTLPELGGNTLRASVAVWMRLPDFPVMVTVEAPMAAEPVTASVRRQVAGVAPALKDPTTPLGRPEKLTVTMLVNPFCGVKVTVLLPEEPCGMLRAAGEADNVNVGGRAMVSAMAVLLVSAPDAPVIVTVAVPVAAVAAAVKVIALVRPAVRGPKVAVTPAGSPEKVSATVALKLF